MQTALKRLQLAQSQSPPFRLTPQILVVPFSHSQKKTSFNGKLAAPIAAVSPWISEA